MTIGLLASVLCAALPAAEALRVETSRDLWLSSYRTEQEGNNGGAPKLKLKGTQEFFLIDFDPAKLKGRRVVRATLHLHLESPYLLGRTTVSTVAQEWVEGKGTGYAKETGASSFRWARTGEERWGGDGQNLTSVTLGLAGSTWGFGDPTPPDANRWQVIPIDPAVVQARLDGRSHGFLVMDDVGSEYRRDGDQFIYSPFPNRFVASREGKKGTAPYFTLWLEDGSAPATSSKADPTLPVTPAVTLPPLPPQIAPAGELAATDALGLPIPGLRLFAAKGEAVTMRLPTSPEKISIDLPVRRYDLPPVGAFEDPLVAAANGRLLEFQIPKDARAGEHRGTLQVAGQEYAFTVHVWNFTLPDRLSFVAQMNGYGMSDMSRDWFRLAHEHRLTLNMLPYGWTGRVTAAPKLRPDGSFDWQDWDKFLGPLLDGSAFADLPRGPVPTEALYLPLNENWPMAHERHFKGGYWIEHAYDDAYWQEFRAAAGNFARHFAEKGWHETTFEFYLNNKVYFKNGKNGKPGNWKACSAPWIFDEPQHTQDFWAIRRFGLEYWEAVKASADVRMAFRLDVSRPEWQRDLLDGVSSVDVVSGTLRDYPRRVVGRNRRDGKQTYMYGTVSKLGQPLAINAAWCAETWALGADGVVPWQTIGKKDALTKPDDLAVLYPGPNGPLPSLRLKSFRAGQQLAEYLTMYAAASGQDRDAIGAAVLALPGLRAGTIRTSADDAGSSAFGQEAGRSVTELRLRLGTWLDAQAPAPRARWHDPRPKVVDHTKLRPIVALPVSMTK
ncbi:MAG: hypothetical protein RL592_1424 [Verrucomicrobiota bacterium]